MAKLQTTLNFNIFSTSTPPENYCDAACLLNRTGVTAPNNTNDWTPAVASNPVVKALVEKVEEQREDLDLKNKEINEQSQEIKELKEDMCEVRNLTNYLKDTVAMTDGWIRNYFDRMELLWSDELSIACQILAAIEAPVIAFITFLCIDRVNTKSLFF